MDPSAWVAEKGYDGREYDVEKHRRERADRGFSTYDWWNFFDYIAWVNINALEKFKTGSGFPGNLSGPDEWTAILDKMIDGFKAAQKISNDFDVRTYKDDRKTMMDGLHLYAEYFCSLWD